MNTFEFRIWSVIYRTTVGSQKSEIQQTMLKTSSFKDNQNIIQKIKKSFYLRCHLSYASNNIQGNQSFEFQTCNCIMGILDCRVYIKTRKNLRLFERKF